MVSLSIYIQTTYNFHLILDVRHTKNRTSKIVQPLLVGIRLPLPYSPLPKGRGSKEAAFDPKMRKNAEKVRDILRKSTGVDVRTKNLKLNQNAKV